jgi:hypothetical protein
VYNGDGVFNNPIKYDTSDTEENGKARQGNRKQDKIRQGITS